jgi:hypothetical protein
MLSANQANISTAIRLDRSPAGIQVSLGDQIIGTVAEYPVCNLDIAVAGLTDKDTCFVVNNTPYKFLESAVGAVTAAYLILKLSN